MDKQVELIKAEIERLQDSKMDSDGNFQTTEDEVQYHLLCHLENFINSLPEEPVSKELEKAAIEYCSGNKGADARVRTGFLQGAQWQEQQMMEKAVEWIEYNNNNGGCLFDDWEENFRKEMRNNH